MPPHCDSMDGPVVAAAKRALEASDVGLVLPYVKASGDAEVIAAFDRATAARDGDPKVNEVVDLYFFETVVRVHRAGEGAPYTGLKPAGLPVGPVIPIAERAIETGRLVELEELLVEKVRHELHHRFEEVISRKAHAAEGLAPARAYVQAMLGLEVWSHRLFGCLEGPAHAGEEHGD